MEDFVFDIKYLSITGQYSINIIHNIAHLPVIWIYSIILHSEKSYIIKKYLAQLEYEGILSIK